MKEYKGLYYGERKITEYELSSEKTPGGKDIVKVKFDNEKFYKLIPEIMMEYLASEKQGDASSLRDKKILIICSKVIDVLAETDIGMSELEFFVATLKGSISNSFENAEEIKWGTDEKTLLDIDRALKVKVDN